MVKEPGILERKFVPKGTVVMRQGEEGDCAYLIQSGSVSVYTEIGERRLELARLETGQIFGEMALVFDEPRTASVSAYEDCNLIVITRESFKHKLLRSDPTIKAIVGMLTKRIVTTNNTLVQKQTSTDDLIENCHATYQNILDGLPNNQKRTFQNAVFPKLEGFLDTLKAFGERFDQD